MFNISEKTEIIGWDGKRSTLDQAVHDKSLNRNWTHDYFGKTVRRGTVELFLKGEWRNVRFDEENGWAHKVEVL